MRYSNLVGAECLKLKPMSALTRLSLLCGTLSEIRQLVMTLIVVEVSSFPILSFNPDRFVAGLVLPVSELLLHRSSVCESGLDGCVMPRHS